MDNEPVAYVTGVRQFDPVMVDITLKVGTPLYTHPAEHDLAIAEAIGFEKGHESAATMLRQQQVEIDAGIELIKKFQEEREELKKRNLFLETFYRTVKACQE
jgi:hypothetical protein